MKYLRLFIYLIIALLTVKTAHSQATIGGNINFYAAVDSIYPTGDTLDVDDASPFSSGDTIMVIQMQGAEARRSPADDFYFWGRLELMYNAGVYEIIIIRTVQANRVILRVPLDRAYDESKYSNVQIVKIPTYKEAIVQSKLTCDPWDGKKGGVLALLVHDTLVFNADVDASGVGFRGAQPVFGMGQCAYEDSVFYRNYVFLDTITRAGSKGEGIAVADSMSKGVGIWVTGGGGGNARWAGGGGGSNAGSGGNGGDEDTTICTEVKYVVDEGGGPIDIPHLGGRGALGLAVDPQYSKERLYMGGGGGSGTYSSTGVPGASGGGIVFILSSYMEGNGHTIYAYGDSVKVEASESAGGGGGGGNVLLEMDSLASTLNIDVSGGAGGNTIAPGITGPGGGGGGGFFSNPRKTIHSGVNFVSNGGSAGRVTDQVGLGTHGAGVGEQGEIEIDFMVPLTGFLFNSIVRDQLVCDQDYPKTLFGSTPRGGTGTYEFLWQISLDSTTWNDAAGTNNTKHYGPDKFVQDTIYYRRVVTSGLGVDKVSDTSNVVMLKLQPRIQGNSISILDQLMCEGIEADSIKGTTVKIGGSGIGTYIYYFQSSFDTINWVNTSKVNDTLSLPGYITDTTYYRRIVRSGGCRDTSTVHNIDVQPAISNFELSLLYDTICYNQKPELIIGNPPEGGNGSTYQFSWWESPNGSAWSNTDSTRVDFQPPNLTDDIFYQRVIKSGECIDSNTVQAISVLPSIGNNILDNITPQNGGIIFTCYGTKPEKLIGQIPTGGDGSYAYVWESSSNGLSWSAVTDSISKDFQSDSLLNPIYYRRIVNSGEANCCSDKSDSININIHELPIATLGSFDSTICSAEPLFLEFELTAGQSPWTITYSDGVDEYQMENVISSLPIDTVRLTTNEVENEYQIEIVNVIDANGCIATDKSGWDTILVYGLPNANAGDDFEICALQTGLNADPSIGDGYWTVSSGPGTAIFEDSSLYHSSLSVDRSGKYNVRWTETNWQCVDSASITAWFYQAPQNVYAGADTSIFFIDQVDLNGRYTNPDIEYPIQSLWEIVSGAGTIRAPDSRATKLVDLNQSFDDHITLLWTVSKGDCADIVDTLHIGLENVKAPTGFSPNDDGINDRLIIRGLENSLDNKLIIFNRWGVEVFSDTNYNNEDGWDGTNEKGVELPEDTYYWILTATDGFGRTHSYKGYVVLKRR